MLIGIRMHTIFQHITSVNPLPFDEPSFLLVKNTVTFASVQHEELLQAKSSWFVRLATLDEKGKVWIKYFCSFQEKFSPLKKRRNKQTANEPETRRPEKTVR